MLYTNSNIANVAYNYIHKLNISVTKTTLKNTLQNNPYYPSLYSLNHVFERFNIDTEAYQIDKEKLVQLQPPFIVYCRNQPTGKDFVLITSLDNNQVKYISNGEKEKILTKEKFLKDWENIVFIAKKKDGSGERSYLLNLRKEKTKKNKVSALIAATTVVFSIVIFLFLYKLPSDFILSSSLLLVKLAGLFTAVLLLAYEIDKNNNFVKTICSVSKQTNCNAVLQSKAAKIFGISWSEMGLFYFGSTCLLLLIPGISFPVKTSLLSMAASLTVPYIFFSIYFQWKVVKEWCPLCLTALVILAIELTWSIINFWRHPFLPDISITLITSILFCILLPIVVWYGIKPILKRAKNEPLYKGAYNRLLYNPETFKSILKQQPFAPDGYQHIGITSGNAHGDITIIKVCNPYCAPCAKAHAVLDEIIHHNKNVKVKLIFVTNDEAAKHLIAINAQDANQTERALADWYMADKKDYNVFAAKYPMNGEIKKHDAEIEKMGAWCKAAEIIATPTLFINGYKLPEIYTIEDLKKFL